MKTDKTYSVETFSQDLMGFTQEVTLAAIEASQEEIMKKLQVELDKRNAEKDTSSR